MIRHELHPPAPPLSTRRVAAATYKIGCRQEMREQRGNAIMDLPTISG